MLAVRFMISMSLRGFSRRWRRPGMEGLRGLIGGVLLLGGRGFGIGDMGRRGEGMGGRVVLGGGVRVVSLVGSGTYHRVMFFCGLGIWDLLMVGGLSTYRLDMYHLDMKGVILV